MFRPAINKNNGNVELIHLETCPNIQDYIIVWISKEANEDNSTINGDEVSIVDKVAEARRKKALAQQEAIEQKEIERALEKNINNQ